LSKYFYRYFNDMCAFIGDRDGESQNLFRKLVGILGSPTLWPHSYYSSILKRK
jgi:hypothetical protein